jgi:signal peptidase
MSLRTVGKYIILIFSILLVLSLVAGSILGQPILLSYVETGSMSPTLEPGDGFVAIPLQLAGPIEEGDVVVYEAEEIQGGGLTTHRVVGETERGHITRGDANPFTDQDSGEPPVKRAQTVAVAWQPGGSIVTIPYFGTAVESIQSVLATIQRYLASLFGTGSLLGTQGLAYLFFGLTLLWYIVAEWRATNTKDEQRTKSRDSGTNTRLVVGAFALLLVAGATLPMVMPTGTQEYGVVSAEFDSERPTVIPAGESKSQQQPIANGGRIPVVVYLEPSSEGVEVHQESKRLGAGEVTNATVTLHAPDETGYYRRFVSQHHYLAVLPQSTIRALYQFHPWAPIVVIDALIGIPFYLFGIKLIGTGRIRERTRNRTLPVSTRFRRVLRELY